MFNKKNNNSSNSKWIIIIFSVVLICSIFVTEIMASKEKQIEEIGVNRFINELSGDNEKLVYIKENDCDKCEDMTKVLERVKSIGLFEVFTINIDKLSNNDYEKLLSSTDLIDESKIPSVLHISAGGIIGNYTGEASYNKLMAFTDIFEEITVKQYIELAKEDIEHFIYIGRPTCSYCVQSEPWSKRIIKEMEKTLYYVNIDEETETDLKLLEETTNGIYKGSTPLFLITKNNKIVKYKEGAGTYTALKEFFNGTDGK